MPINSFLYPGAKVTPAYEVANSCRFNDGDSAYMHKTPGGAGTSADLFTFSMWIKRGQISSSDRIVLFDAREDAENFDRISFTSDDTLEWKGIRSDSQTHNLTTSQLFRDTSAWMHLHFIWDSADGTADNRMRIYVNGTQVTAFGTRANPSSGLDAIIGAAQKHSIGSTASSGTYYDGYMCEVVYLDGQELTPDGNTGEFDEDSGIWKPIDVSGLTFGTNGFYLDFEDSSNLGNDANGGTDLTEVNLAATDQSTDTCTNNACTWNTLYRNGATFTQGNLVYQAPSSNPVFGSITTFGVNSGKWYAECKYVSGSNHYGIIGICDEVFATLGDLGSATNTDFGKTGSALGSHPNTCTIAYVINTGAYRNNNNNTSWGSGAGDGDIINIALDRDNRKVYFGVNGTYGNSSNPASGSNGIDLSSLVTGDTYFLGVTNDTGASETVLDFNFGAGFGQTAVSSGNSDANGYGNFEYAVPSGFYAWNSKNLAEFG